MSTEGWIRQRCAYGPECCGLINEFVDESDPDLNEPQIEHLLQMAEAIRTDYPHKDWLHITALIHDVGKVLLHPSLGAEPQWCIVFQVKLEFKKPSFPNKAGDLLGEPQTPQNHGATTSTCICYAHLMNDGEKEMLKWLHVFNFSL